MEKIVYKDNEQEKGIVYDWKKIAKEYKKLNCPKWVYDPTKIPWNSVAFVNLLSERETGKTTNLLLYGMVMNKLYGTQIQYVRATETEIMNKTINDLFNTILTYDYIYKITGKYHDVIYKARRWYFCNFNNEGKVEEIAPEHFMMCLSIDKQLNYKSGYNAPLGDFLIFDEYIGKYYRMNEFVDFMQLTSTIFRSRECCKIIMLANTTNIESEYFNELEIYDEVHAMEEGKPDIFTTPLGTRIYVEILKNEIKREKKKIVNSLYYGFKNPQLKSITGGGWAMNNYPHIERGWEMKEAGLYLLQNNKLLALDFVEYPDKGLYINCHKASKTYDDSIIYTLSELKDSRYRFALGSGNDNLSKFVLKMVKMNRIKFANNTCGTLFYNHIRTIIR